MFLQDIFESLDYQNKVTFFGEPSLVLDYLLDPAVQPFIILSDINMLKMDGFELRNLILDNPVTSKKCLPYLFILTLKSPQHVIKAFDCHILGFFKKEEVFNAYKKTIHNIME